MGFKADVALVSDASMELARDQGDLLLLQASVAAKQAEIEGDTGAINTANDTVSTDLIPGPKFILKEDGSVDVYAHADVPPGFTVTNVQPAD